MTRSAGEYFAGSIPAFPTTADISVALYDAILTEWQDFESAATTAWETYDNMGTRDNVLRSVGDRSLVSGAGDMRDFKRLRKSGDDIYLRGYQDWTTASGGSGSRATTEILVNSSLDPSGNAVTYYGMRNEYEFSFFWTQNDDVNDIWSMMACGSPYRTHVPPSCDGIAFTTALATAAGGSNVVISLDRNIVPAIRVSPFQQKAWIYEIADGAALPSATVEVLNVEAITASTITLKILSNKKAGSIVGLDPCPSYVWVIGSGGSSGEWVNRSTGAAGGSATVFTPIARALHAATNEDPSVSGLRRGVRIEARDDTNPTDGFRGLLQHIVGVSYASAADAGTDKARVNFDDSKIFRIFSGLEASGGQFRVSIGPGAPV